jgi:hypothetical protein
MVVFRGVGPDASRQNSRKGDCIVVILVVLGATFFVGSMGSIMLPMEYVVQFRTIPPYAPRARWYTADGQPHATNNPSPGAPRHHGVMPHHGDDRTEREKERPR